MKTDPLSIFYVISVTKMAKQDKNTIIDMMAAKKMTGIFNLCILHACSGMNVVV